MRISNDFRWIVVLMLWKNVYLQEVSQKIRSVVEAHQYSLGKNSKAVIVTSMVYVPFVNKTLVNNDTFVYSGALFEMFDKIVERLNLSYQVLEPPDQMYGALTPNGTWNGLIRMLVDEEADVAIADLTVTYIRSTVVDFSAPFHFETVGIMIKITENEDAVFRIFLLFSPQAWIAVMISAFMMVFAVRIHNAIVLNYKNEGVGRNFVTSVWFVFSTLLNQTTLIREKSWSGRCFQLFWRFSCLMMCTFYIGNMVATLSTSRYSIPFQDVHGLMDYVESGRYKLCVHNNTAFYSAAMSDSFYAPFKTFLTNNFKYANSPENCRQIFFSEPNVAYICEVSYLNSIQKNHSCDANNKMVVLNERLFPGYYGLAFRKNFPYKRQMSEAIIELDETGLIQLWKDRYSVKAKCTITNVDPENPFTMTMQTLKLKEMLGAFLTLVFGIAVSISIFAIERRFDLMRLTSACCRI